MQDSGFAIVPRGVLHNGALSGYAKLLYALLASHANTDGECWPSVVTLAAESGWSRPTVIKAIGELVAARLVARRHGRFANTYRLPQTDSTSFTPTETESTSLNSTSFTPTRRSKPSLLTESTSFTDGVNDVDTNDTHLTKTIERKEVPEVRDLWNYYREHIQPKARTHNPKKIAARLKRFSVAELKEGIDHFAADAWWMENNASRGADWFFDSDRRSEQFLNMDPRPGPAAPPPEFEYVDHGTCATHGQRNFGPEGCFKCVRETRQEEARRNGPVHTPAAH